MIVAGFLLGMIVTASLVAALFFLKFWRESHDALFLAFAAFFFVEAFSRMVSLAQEHPNEASPWVYVVRFASAVWIIAAILRKNS